MDRPERRLPIFPLNVVLFPRMRLPLHIFEQRYRVMLADCQAGDGRFGIVLIRSGDEVGGPAEPCDVGTVACITDARPTGDGRYDIATIGEERFRILEIVEERPYLQARVALLGDDVGGEWTALLADQTAELMRKAVLRKLALTSEWTREIPLPSGPEALSYYIATRLELPVAARQQLLEAPTSGDRLRLEATLLEGALTDLESAIQTRQWLGADLFN